MSHAFSIIRARSAAAPGLSVLALGLLALGSSPLPGCAPARGSGSAPGSRPATDRLTIGAYSVVREAFHEGVLPGFAAAWKRRTGRSVRFEESYNGSGAQSRAIASGLDADVAVLALERDIDRLVEAGLVANDWRAGPERGMITRSLVVVAVREGNPHNIRDWNDLAGPGVAVLYPDPKTSGGARWNVSAIYGAGLLAGANRPDPEAARRLLARVQKNVVNMDASGRQSMATFERGTGDAAVTYENEILLQRRRQGRPIAYVVPPATLLIEGPAAIVEPSVRRHGNRAVAEAFLAYLRSDEGQRILAEFGFRPLDSTRDRRPLPPRLFTIAELGGWTRVNREIYGPGGVWDSLFTTAAGGRNAR